MSGQTIPLRLSLRALRAFTATVEQGSISGAAQALNVAPSAISALLDQVEAEFGATLLVRSRARGVVATAEGRRMAGRFRLLLEDYAEIIEDGHEIAKGMRGTLRVGYYAPVGPAFLPGILTPLMHANPGLRLDLQETDNDTVQERLLSGDLDVILFAGQDMRAGIETHPLLDLPPYVLVPAGHPLATNDRTTLNDVSHYPLIELNRPLARPYVSRLFSDRKLSPEVVARANTTEMVRSLVGAGLGIAILAMRPQTHISYAGDPLRALPLDPGLPRLQLLSGKIPGQNRRLVSAFMDVLHGWANSPSALDFSVR
ncbi:MAG TPA: LysR family transcriptional regulator [Roseovarius sp.]|nr:LysR family transcriptional regulator [Roseovarius sp.]